jgi:hypothetical protein
MPVIGDIARRHRHGSRIRWHDQFQIVLLTVLPRDQQDRFAPATSEAGMGGKIDLLILDNQYTAFEQ